ncbi:MAG: 3-hydroxy-3-methylglutaryl-CoA reductase, partial [Halobacteria archaeon]
MSLLERVVDGEISLHEIEEHLSGEDVADEAADLRREAVEHRTDTDLNGLADPSFDMGDVSDRNVENLVGRIEVPVGVVGPIEVDGEDAEGEYHVPVATTEGALVASVNRGCSAVCDAGGVDSVVVKDAMTRAPVFKTSGVRESRKLALWVEDNLDRLIEASESTTDHGELLWIDPYVAGDNVYLRMGFDTKDAMGMNMATIAAKEACELIEEAKYPDCRLVALSGNLCSDKKPAAINAVEGRGKTVTADATIPAPLVERKLKTSVEDFLEVHERKTMVGSTRAGILGANAHVANILS